MAIPSAAEMEALAATIPSEDEMALLAGSSRTGSRARVAPRAKPPCKYGPRGEDGRCPKKPSQYLASAATGSSPSSRPPCKYGPRDEYGRCPPKPRASVFEQVAVSTARAGAGHLTDVALDVGRNIVKNRAEIKALLKSPAAKQMYKAAGKTALTLSAYGLAALATFYAGKWAYDRIRARGGDPVKERAAELNAALREATLDAVEALGRSLTPDEHYMLYSRFKDEFEKLAKQAQS